MPHRGSILAGLATQRRRWVKLVAGSIAAVVAPVAAGRLVAVENFGANPGRLRMFVHVPARLAPRPALVVVLHGCTQTAAGYDIGAGWSTLADRYGFAVLLPEQTSLNNPRSCFNWFRAEDIARDRGEAGSIRQMVTRAVADHGVDRGRIFVTGLSAGGAMANALLATYPDVFAAGAVIAGVPFGCATTVQQALDTMRRAPTRPAREWGDLVRAATTHRGPWPRVSVWHGDSDTVVAPLNAHEIVKQWTDVHGLPEAPGEADRVDGHPRRLWRRPDGTTVIEDYTIAGMAHGTPLAIAGVEGAHGAAGPFLLDVGIASSYHIAKFFGLTGAVMTRRAEPPGARVTESPRHRGAPAAARLQDDVAAAIARALRAAGLLRG